MPYKPKPLDTSEVKLSQNIRELVEMLAKNTHEIWARQRLADGWTLGAVRDDAARKHPCLVAYEELPETEKDYDRHTALETIKALLALGYRIEPPSDGAQQSAAISAIEQSLKKLFHWLQEVPGKARESKETMLSHWHAHNPTVGFVSPETYAQLSEKLLKFDEPLVAYDVAAEGSRFFEGNLRLRQLRGLALARSGAIESAQEELLALYQEGHRDQETLGPLARTYKDLALECADPQQSQQLLRQSFAYYAEAHGLSGGYYTGINASTVALLLNDREKARSLALGVAEDCRNELCRIKITSPDRYWPIATLGEAALILENWSEAEDWYHEAMQVQGPGWSERNSTRRNARLIVRHLGADWPRFDKIFQVPRVVVFAGHMIDHPSRKSPRFPPALEDAVGREIRARLDTLGAGSGFASAACGSDILFHEALLTRGGEIHVFLPFDEREFLRDSVDFIPGSHWKARFKKLLEKDPQHQVLMRQELRAGSISFEFTNLVLYGMAALEAEKLETELVAMAVWDGLAGDGPGGTAGNIERWRGLGHQVEVINLADILARELPRKAARLASQPGAALGPKQAEEFTPVIRGLLFGDVHGFSDLTEEQVPQFVHCFLGLVGELVVAGHFAPIFTNTWGDGLYFVFSTARDAGCFALELSERVRSTDWESMGLPEDMSIRIGVHAGPVLECLDPVTRRTNFMGAQVSRAARIEPITPPGHVYASQEFAAIARAEKAGEFRCDYVGQVGMAKHYGVFPTYIVRRRAVRS
ncbi:MAG: RyR domain-containing protein [Candidatus Acidiferrales bacterium]